MNKIYVLSSINSEVKLCNNIDIIQKLMSGKYMIQFYETKLYSFTSGRYGKFIAEIITFTINGYHFSTDSLEKTLMLGKTEGMRRKG